MSRQVREVFVPVPQKYMGRIIGTRGSNVKQIAQETRTTIKTCNGENFGEGPGFLVIGISRDCKGAERAIRSYIRKTKGVRFNRKGTYESRCYQGQKRSGAWV